MIANIRKIAVNIEETHREIGRDISPATRKAVAVAVIENPFAGAYHEDLTQLMDIGAELGALLGEKCVAALGITPDQAESYGKSAMVGENGELEHAAAILHPKLGAPCGLLWKKGPHWCRHRKRWADRDKCWMCLWDTKTRPMCAAILTGSKSA